MPTIHFQIVDKWKTSPILVSFDSSVTPISEIPFPALTICNYNKVRKSRVEHLEEKMEQEPNNDLWKKEHLFVDEVCASHLDHGRFFIELLDVFSYICMLHSKTW